MMSMLTAESLKKSFGAIEAVRDVSLSIERGEAFGLLGPNGAGKTTTINMMIGLLSPDSGSVRLDGNDDPSHPSTRRRIGPAPQTLSLYEELSARENLLFFGRLYGLDGERLQQRLAWALDFAELQDRARHRVKTFSGGMKRRLNFAAAMIHQPEVVLLDEPTVGVDPQSRNHLFENVEKLKSDGLTIIYTTHYMEEAQRLCDRVAIIDHGTILANDSVDGLIESHGGTSVVTAMLRTVPPDAVELPAKLEGLELRFESEHPLDDVGNLVSQGVVFDSLQVSQPDLESVFLHLTGRSLRD